MMKIGDFMKVIENVPKRAEGKSILNPVQHFRKLVDSHELTDENDVRDFFELLYFSQEFFQKENMPEEWSLRTYAAAISTLEDIIKFPEVQNIFKDMDFVTDSLITLLEKQRKNFNSAYKRQQRQKNKNTTKISLNSSDLQKLIIQENSPINATIESDDDKSSVSSFHEIQLHDDIDNRCIDKQQDDKINVTVEKDSKYNEDTLIEGKTNIEVVPTLNKQRIDARVSYIVNLLEKYKIHEENNVKKAYLEIVKDQLKKLTIIDDGF